MTAYQRVLAQPSSLAAREALAAEWKAARDPRAELVAKQLRLRELRLAKRLWTDEANALTREIKALVAKHGAQWAGDIAKQVNAYAFHRGCVAEVTMSGALFLRVMPALLDKAPVQHVNLTKPLELPQLVASPHLAKVWSLKIIELHDAFGDKEATLLAGSAHVANLKWMSLTSNTIGMAGVEALVKSPHLARCLYLNLEGNPINPTPSIQEYEGMVDATRPGIAEMLETKHGSRPWLQAPDVKAPWPPDRDDVSTTA